jgi:pantothenate kinase type III
VEQISKLPKVKIEAPKNSIGKDTISAMMSGIVLGHKCMIEGMIKKCENELTYGRETAIIEVLRQWSADIMAPSGLRGR